MNEKTGNWGRLDLDLNYNYLFYRRTKIVATIGPASDSEATLRALIKKGMNVARINFSHGVPADHVRLIARIRRIARSLNATVTILGDLCGPKIRVGTFREGSIDLKAGSTVCIAGKNVPGHGDIIPSQYPGIVRHAKIGERILLDDGNLELKITGKQRGLLKAKVLRGGPLKSNKGMNLPDTDMKISALTEKDRRDALSCIQAEVDYIALSFVRHPKDILDLKKLLAKSGADIRIIAKIEKPEALGNIDKIIELADGIMIARGDLGVEMPAQKVPLIQNRLIALSNQRNKPVIVATQMMESMVEQSRPTRAEVSDVAGACMAGADAVMLSAETASGKYPVESLSIMNTVLREIESYQFFSLGGMFRKAGRDNKSTLPDVLGISIAQLSRDLMARSIFIRSSLDTIARMVSSNRPAAPIFTITHQTKAASELNLLWGVNPILIPRKLSQALYVQFAEETIKKRKLGEKGNYFIVISGHGNDRRKSKSIEIHQLR